jgi:hypothetical protein
VPIPLQWDGQPGPAHVDTVETANRLYDFLPQALHRIHGAAGAPPALQAATIAPLAVGGGMAVYKITEGLCLRHTVGPVGLATGSAWSGELASASLRFLLLKDARFICPWYSMWLASGVRKVLRQPPGLSWGP